MDKKSNINGLAENIQHLPLLIYLSDKIGLNKTDSKSIELSKSVTLSTIEIAKDMNFSQQTASRKMQELEELGFIKKRYSPNGLMIGLTDDAIALLKSNYNHLKNIFEKKKSSKKISGLITSGIGEGKFYVQIEKYNNEFKALLGNKPFPGTLNVIVDADDYKNFLLTKEFIKISGFKTKERSFGWINCYKIKVQKNNKQIDAYITIPERTSHQDNIAEIIAHVYLRKELNIKDNDKVEIL
ncbi:MAG: DUF120 domain-containing protein [Candidatus Woesearchaeota archaeon]